MFSSTLRWNCNLPIFSWKDLSNLFVCCCIKVKKYVLFYLFVYSSIYFIRFSMNMHLQSLALLVGLDGLEPSTSRLSGVRSNHLSYRPVLSFGRAVFLFLTAPRSLSMVEMRGIEPLTPCLQSRCSPSWATPPYLIIWVLSVFWASLFNGHWKPNNKIYKHQTLSCALYLVHLCLFVLSTLNTKGFLGSLSGSP